MIAGNTIGAGILGFPILTGLAGFLPALVGLTFIWFIMFGTGYILVERLTIPGSDISELPSLYLKDVGRSGKGVAIIGYLINYYGVLVAYLAGASAIAIKLWPAVSGVPDFVIILIFFVVFTSFTLFGVEVVRHGNFFLMTLLFISFIVLVVMAVDVVDFERLNYTDWSFFPATIPIILVAFTYHNTVPVACRILDFNRRSARRALFIGTFIPWILTILWTTTVVGALPLENSGNDSILFAFTHNLPATIPLARVLGTPFFMATSLVFAILAIITSYVAVGTGLMGFMRDLTKPILPFRNRLTDALLAFGPPLIVTLIYPNLFLSALNVAGGVGVAIAFGILPATILIKISKGHTLRKTIGIFLLIFFLVALAFEISQEFGVLDIHPSVEHWTSPLKK